MGQQGAVVTCRCGHKMVIPSGHENRAGRCPNCLAIIRPTDLLAQARPETTKPEKSGPAKAIRIRTVAKTTAIWGGLAGLALGAVGTVAGGVLGPATLVGAPSRLAPAVATGFLGMLVGVLLGATWGITKAADLNLGLSITAGTTIGACLALVDWLAEDLFVRFSTPGLFECLAVGILGGVVTGIVTNFMQNYD